MAFQDAYNSIFSKTNKWGKKETEDTTEGVVSDLTPELELEMKDEDLLKLTKQWEKKWEDSTIKGEWLEKCEEAENYWLGKQFGKAESEMKRPLVDNMIFEALETFLPLATRRNPEANVELENKELNNNPAFTEFADVVEKKLLSLADKLKLRLKLKKGARHWSIYLIGVAKLGWSVNDDDISVKIIRPKKLILDPDSTIEEDGYTGKFIGEYREMEAAILVKLIPNKKAFIEDLVKGDMGTMVGFKEFWTDEYMCWILNSEVLLKKQNPHWNYDSEKTTEITDEFGAVTPQLEPVKGLNHFSTPRMPYKFLSIFNLGKHPIDDTSLILQNLPLQDLTNKRYKQIDRNADSMNNGIVVSEERSGLTKEQASQATEALRKGGTIVIPTGSPNDAITRFNTQALPSDIFNQLNDARTRLRDVFGVAGSTAAGIQNEDTVRGKIINRGLDTDRIGGGVTEYLEQWADDILNYMVQMMYVYYPEFKDIPPDMPKLLVSVKEGSLLPKDNTTEANQAIELAVAGKMSLLDMYRKLEYPNPEEMAANVWLETNAPQVLYATDQRVAQVMQQQAEAQQMQMAQQGQMQEQQIQSEQQGKQVDQKNKLELQDRKQQGELLKQVQVNNAKSVGK